MIEEKKLELALNSSSVDGFNNPKTMKFFSEVRGRRVVILLDSRATHNFIFERLVEKLNLSMTPTKFAITLGDQRKIKRMGKCNW